MKRFEYKAYINSPEWEAKKRQFKASPNYRDGRCFVCCNSGIEKHIHHLTYKRLGREKLGDLRVLCAVCHAAAHSHISKKLRRKWHPHASRNNLWKLRNKPLEYAYEVAKFFGVLNHDFVVRIFGIQKQGSKTD